MASTTRQALLQALSAAEGAYISGQQLAQQLGVSRAAVHKAAAALTAQGYALEAASRRGYRLLGGDPFCTEAVGPYPAPVQLYDTLESTNRTAKLLALEGAAHGTLCAGGQADAVFHPAAGAAGQPAQRAHRPRAHGAVHGLPRDGGAARRCVLPDVSHRRAVPEPSAHARHRMARRRGGQRAFGAGCKAAAARAGARGRVCRRGERGGVSAGDFGAVFLPLPARGHGLSRARGLRDGPAAAAAGAERAERRAAAAGLRMQRAGGARRAHTARAA